MNQAPEGYMAIPTGLGYTDTLQPFYGKFDEEHARFGFYVEDKHCNPAGVCHGGALMTFLDIAFGGTVMNKFEGLKGLPTINMNTDFVAPGKKGDWLESQVTFIHMTKTMVFIGGVVTGSEGPVVRANASFKLPKGAVLKP